MLMGTTEGATAIVRLARQTFSNLVSKKPWGENVFLHRSFNVHSPSVASSSAIPHLVHKSLAVERLNVLVSKNDVISA